MTPLRPHRMRITVRVSRRVGAVQQVLYVFAGTVGAATLRDVLEQVWRLINAAPGRWRIECVASGLDASSRQQVATAWRELRRAGEPIRPMRARLHAELRVLLARTASIQ